jgi:CRP-like cAMP-binding protein
MTRDPYLQHLASVSLFSRCTKRQLEEVASLATELVLPAGRVLAHQGGVGLEMFILLDGAVSVIRDGQHVATVTAGEVVGEQAVLSGHRRNATLVAETEVSVLVLTRSNLEQLLDDVPGLANRLLHEVSARTA